ncbi:Ultraviolet N-glycosylase/AP lyase [Methylacidimicrobium cyclopophantes]|uniref:Endonuclease III n=1 Tax=Methylacidimicrobium cyclopophantes TaxID=1041766 RepID=A0A5E6MF37_9BACT|nr:endonuclease III [Methylacidimicrobium cyclopophantes]VVM06861.1 Ultraviolet N-glycosylase/AP lyase [Methylacidimicrobium cyclopophantes]
METTEAKRRRVAEILRILRRLYPNAKLALAFSNPLELLVALILAAQARDELVNAITAPLFHKYRTAADWASAPPDQLEGELRKINFYRNKTRAIQKACRALIDRFGGKVPDRLEDLLSLPGVGRKTANIVLGNAFGQPTIGVDTHVSRVAGRLGLTTQTDPDKIEADLVVLVPEEDRVAFCHLLQAHGRAVCTARNPGCDRCELRELCPYPRRSSLA